MIHFIKLISNELYEKCRCLRLSSDMIYNDCQLSTDGIISLVNKHSFIILTLFLFIYLINTLVHVYYINKICLTWCNSPEGKLVRLFCSVRGVFFCFVFVLKGLRLEADSRCVPDASIFIYALRKSALEKWKMWRVKDLVFWADKQYCPVVHSVMIRKKYDTVEAEGKRPPVDIIWKVEEKLKR